MQIYRLGGVCLQRGGSCRGRAVAVGANGAARVCDHWARYAVRDRRRHTATQSGTWHATPKAWHAGEDPGAATYSAQEVAAWRSNFGFAMRQHSLAASGYTDDELVEWRKVFDVMAQDDQIAFPAFEHFVSKKWQGIIPDRELTAKVRYYWSKFDRDHNNFVDFGEFIGAGLLFDIDWAKNKIRRGNIQEVFAKYAEDDFMSEVGLFTLMCDFRFFVATATDVLKFVRNADEDRDGLISREDFVQWAESTESCFESAAYRDPWTTRPGKAASRKVLLPPPEPED